MTDEEKKAKEAADAKEAEKLAADAKAAKEAEEAAQTAKDVEEANANTVLLAKKDEEIKKLTSDRDNYRNVALKRLGKNPGDADFVAGADETTGLTVEETVRKELIDREIDRLLAEKDATISTIAKENAELKLALKNRPGGSTIGNGSGESSEVKDNVFSSEQIATLTARAKQLGADPTKFIEATKKNLLNRG